MTYVVVAGSKPGLRLPPAHAVYAANAAVLTAPQAFEAVQDLCVVASGHVLAKGLHNDGAGAALYARKFAAVRDFPARRIVLLTHPDGTEDTARLTDALLSAHPDRPVDIMTAADRRRLVRKVSGARYPIAGRSALKQHPRVLLRDATTMARCVLNWSFGSGEQEVPPRYRPSTGLLALLLAIRDHGACAQYCLAGIGLTDRNRYAFSNGAQPHLHPDTAKAASHVLPDQSTLLRVAQKYRITTTEPELADMLPLFDG